MVSRTTTTTTTSLCQLPLFLVVFLFISTRHSVVVAFRRNNNNNKNNVIIKEVLPLKLQNDLDLLENNNDNNDGTVVAEPKRRLIWFGKLPDEYDERIQQLLLLQLDKKQKRIETHPLRTDQWELNINWFPTRRRKGIFSFQKKKKKEQLTDKTLRIEFHPNGYCRLSRIISSSSSTKNDNDNNHMEIIGIGRWNNKPWGVWFSIVPDNEMTTMTTEEYTFTAGLHLNPFGKQPKLLQGSILLLQQQNNNKEGYYYDEEQDWFFVPKPKRKWFRPVVGTFTGVGVGRDTMDLSYPDRIFGLSQ